MMFDRFKGSYGGHVQRERSEKTLQIDALARMAKDGDRSAANELARAMRPFLRSISRRYAARNGVDCSDVLQEAYVATIQALKSWRPDGCSFLTYALYRATVYASRAEMHRDKTRREDRVVPRLERSFVSIDKEDAESGRSLQDALPASTPQPDALLEEKRQALVLEQAMEKLKLREQQILRLSLSGASLVEIAERLQISRQFVSRAKAAGFAKLLEAVAS